MTLACGIDVGGTKIAGGVVDEAGRIIEELRVESPATDEEAIEQAIETLVAELRARHDIAAVGVGVAGYINRARSVVMFAANMAVRDLDLKADLEQRLDLPVFIENDANAAAWGEFQFGAGHDVEELLLVTVGTGIGGGVVLDGQLYRGAFGVGAEIGHLRVVPDGLPCGCGNRGCFEMYASGNALVRRARAAASTGSPAAADLLGRAGGDPAGITGPLITDAAHEGDAFACEQLAELGRWLGEGIASITAVLDPALVVIGGGVSAADDLLLDPIRDGFAAQRPGHDRRPMLEIRKAELGNRAGMIGAADLTRH
ncbi:ROK family glucokinase [Nocardioides cynanchi]|uniref:ROK family glucokinase n=1 Tax=Nocardioides cynanchi TaxID=2558918 RepID=UPI0012482C48|nr:ROK family glucokinase [Nocardioides cynanchi]